MLCGACAPVAYVKPPHELLREAKMLPPEEACTLLTEALSSGHYSAQRHGADTMSALNDEYQLGQARELACRGAEKRARRAAEIEQEQNLVILRTIAWSAGEDEALRRRAAAELLRRLRDETRVDMLQALAAMVPPPSPWPEWYVAMGVEEALEERLQALVRTPEEERLLSDARDRLARVLETLEALGLASAEGRHSEADKRELAAREDALCKSLRPLSAPMREALRNRSNARVLDRYLSGESCAEEKQEKE